MSKIDPEEMRNATLSPGTKEYLVAYRKVEEAAGIVINRAERINTEEEIEPIEKILSEMRNEILRLMTLEIRENLFSTSCTEI